MRLLPRLNQGGFTLVETVSAAGCLALLFGGLFAFSGQSLRLVRYGGQQSTATICLSQRVEEIRRVEWSKIIDSAQPNYLRDYVVSLLSSAPNSASGIPGYSEKIIVDSYPTATAPLTVTRSSAGATNVLTWNSTLTTAQALRVDASISWPNPGGGTSSRQFTTIMTKGGITR